jgi:two-component system phosphate regulon response regulator PhoB
VARILLVDDERDIREMLRDALVLRHHSVDLAESGEAALKLVKNTPPHDIAIIDYVLPGIRGLELLHELRKTNRFLRSIMISGQIDHDTIDTVELEKQLKEQVAVEIYLSKPVSVKRLVEAIQILSSPVSGDHVDWQKLAEHALETRRVKAKHVANMEKTLDKKRRKPPP